MKILLTLLVLSSHGVSFAKTVRVGVLDTGISKEQLKTLPICGTYSQSSPDGVIDTHGHGTNIVGLLNDGADKTSTTDYCFVISKYAAVGYNIGSYLKALAFLVDHKPRLNIIVIASSGPNGYLGEAVLIKRALNDKTAVVVASGNTSLNLDEKNSYPASIDPRLIVVGCNTCMGHGNYGKIVDLYVDGRNKGTPLMTGTSQAAAIVGGRLIKFMQKNLYK